MNRRRLLTLLMGLLALTATAQRLSDSLTLGLNVAQGAQTTGLGNRAAVLLRIDIPAAVAHAGVRSLTVHLKHRTLQHIHRVQLYATRGSRFYSEQPTLMASLPPVGTQLALPVGGAGPVGDAPLHLWLTVDVRPDALIGDSVDAVLTHVDYVEDGQSRRFRVPSAMGDPVGSATIFAVQSFVYLPATDGCRYYRIPAMTLDRHGHLVVAADRRYDSNDDLGQHRIDVSVRRSADGGRTWSPQHIIATGDGHSPHACGYGDPALALTAGGRLICVMAAGATMYWDGMRHAAVCLSDDDGATWTEPRQLYAERFTDVVNGTVDSLGFRANFVSSGKGLTTADGTVMFAANCLRPGSRQPQCYLLTTADEGRHFRLGPELAYAGCDEAKLVQLDDGQLLLSVRQQGPRGFNVGRADGTGWGQQWTNGQLAGTACNADVVRYERRGSGQRPLLLHTYCRSAHRDHLTLSRSTDQGRTWRDLLCLQQGSAAYSTMVVLPTGNVAVLYEDGTCQPQDGYAINYVVLTREQVEAGL